MPVIQTSRLPSSSSGSLHECVTKTCHSLVPTPDLRQNRTVSPCRNLKGRIMKYTLLVTGLLSGLITFLPTEASAVVCARGVYRAGCAGPRGAVVARRPVVAPRAVVVRRGVYVRPR
jgi:hypothetical protein